VPDAQHLFRIRQIRVITDDFTSATDALPAFAQRGWPTRVVLGEGLPAPESPEVWSTDTDSRALDDLTAASRVAAWARQWRDADILVKQFDSTLRGPVACEVMAAWRASGRRKLLVAPAFPAAGRTTVNGEVRVDGVPVADTAFSRDPQSPVRVSSVPRLFAGPGQQLHVARDAAEAIDLLGRVDAVVVDASTEADLQELVLAASRLPDLLWAGSTGLLRAVALALPERQQAVTSWKGAQRPGIVVGSFNPRSRAQLRNAQAHGALVWATPDERGESDALTGELVDKVCDAVLKGHCDGLAVTGGETAKHIARHLQAFEIAVLREVEAGIPLCLMRTPGGEIPLVTKAGGFGDDDVFDRCLQSLRGEI
jgi:D-threonate/D-erythronate kinase